ncbi:MAG: rhodanese-like domain-containing protein [Cycloclasticus pugetii]|uniref:rhodanese-like domain-containing protein n=1 Tax=Cycloclasticus pugetii TaxID=34068 RepID=UPI003A8D4FF2
MKKISATELSSLLEQPNHSLFLLDVREPKEFEYCHLPNSHLIPMQSIPNRLDELPKDSPIITICHHGMRSQQVAQFLLQNGFTDVINLTGGVNAWAAQVDNSMPTY